MSSNLIIDVGMHQCEDTDFYLHLNYQVIAVEPNIDLVKAARAVHQDEIQSGQLRVLNYALADQDDQVVDFNVSEASQWSSMKAGVSSRLGLSVKQVPVQTRRLSTIIREFGTPHFCKIDAAGYESVCLRTLDSSPELPKYISVESECIGEGEKLTDEQALETLSVLHDLGYNQFKLVDQASLCVMGEDKFYFDRSSLLNKLRYSGRHTIQRIHRKRYRSDFNYDFPKGSSGPFGQMLNGVWCDYQKARTLLLRHRNDFFDVKTSTRSHSFSFWCDWHATRVTGNHQ